ncbi:MAG: ABC transporter ATP-binding protein [Chloroflexi bacterium]|nr:MAG: ABC transporter ATP-binding protein [Chloroflexota bacterium]MBL1196624.1 ABC transporter ATP-binding protein [Chloroflexota bacterium]NOH13917.1 ABC transporter ATP-binding protein [Chloroflexota bacterium]
MGFFSGLDVEAYDRQYTDRQLVERIAGYFRPFAVQMFWISFYLILIAFAAAAVPLLTSWLVDLLGEEINNQEIWLVSLAVLASGIFVWAANWIRRRITARVIGDVVLNIRTNAFRAAAGHDLSFYDEFSSARVVSRITSDTREFGQVVTLITDLVSQIVQAIILGAVLFAIDLRLSLWLFGFLPLIFLVALGFRTMARRVTRRGMRAMANVNAAIKETVSGIAVAKNFRQEETIFLEFDDANLSSFRVNLQRGFVLSLVFPSLNALGGIGTSLLLYVGGLSVAEAVVSAGAWFLFLQGLDRFWFPVLNLSAFWTQLQSGLSAAERSFALIDAESSVKQVAENDVPVLKGEIVFDSLCFEYTADENILDRFKLHIRPGENVALVGHTGAGKSSIAKLVARFYEFQDGNLLIDGQDIRSLDLNQYRSQLGIVSQTPFLFSGTVAENIRYARQDASDEEIFALANQIGEGDWLETLSHGLETEVGERGGRLSMGQRQLVALLRVLVQRPAIFILDEATASIDPFTEWQIQQALNMILANTTSILIAHRLSTVKAADRIIVLDDGHIIEEGDHDSLLNQDGHYAELYNTYFRHQSLDYIEEARELAAGD